MLAEDIEDENYNSQDGPLIKIWLRVFTMLRDIVEVFYIRLNCLLVVVANYIVPYFSCRCEAMHDRLIL